jgi:hypothetical protein
MILRSIYFIIIFGLIAGVSYLNQDEKPKEVKNYHLEKLDANGKAISPWSGPWKCVRDKKTSLVWQIHSYDETLLDGKCSFSWFDGNLGKQDGGSCFTKSSKSDTKDIVDYANKIKLCGYSNWRLPTLKELQSLLYNKGLYSEPKIEVDFFPRAKKDVYFSSDIDKEEFSAKALNFKTKKVEILSLDNVARVRLVAEDKK